MSGLLLLIFPVSDSDKPDATQDRGANLDRGHDDYLGNFGHADWVGAFSAATICGAFFAGAGGGGLFSGNRTLSDVLVSPTGPGAGHCAVSGRYSPRQHTGRSGCRIPPAPRPLH